ncbi:LysR family transcriptional regulator [Brachybacterium sp. EF45031]|uniref:LysR family transcriptional regulator n=1 Tax=Brachybacterium sillae TaxID=2810536 RepID=UPI00217EA3A7|nr:LysR family transcriptional regulator [Brachybacterium sillae]MCS6711975.1 LysR family transcriptional regulator [Brachybacterium sillae]
MDPRRLLIFRTVVRNGSIGAGARELGWTQPAVSQHLSALEKEVGTSLLLRSSSGVTPTEAGARLFQHAEAIAAQLAAAEEELADITALRRGRVRFATFPSAAAVLLPPALARMARTAPQVEVTFDELEPPDVIPALLDNELDLALVFRYAGTDVDAEGALEWTPLTEDRVLAVLPLDHPRAEDPDLTLADLADESWVAGCERCRANLLSSAQAAGFTPRIKHSTDDATVVQRLVEHGSGAALLPEIALEASPSENVTVRALPGLHDRTIGLVNRRGALSIPAVAALRDALAAEADQRSVTAALI